jgi:hypothetical protein
VVLAAPLLAGACVRFHGPEDMRAELSQAAGVELEREMGVTVTRSGMALARWAMKDEDEISLKGVRRLEVGVYHVTGPLDASVEPSPLEPPDLEGWQLVLSFHGPSEDVFMLAREIKGEVRNLFLVVAEPEEWVLIRLKGKLDAIFEDAVLMAFEEAGRGDLYTKAEREPGWERPLEDKPMSATS